jgi:hypothetical protein
MKLAAGASRPASPRIEVSMLRNKHKPAPHSSHGNLNERIQMEFDVSNVNVEISKVDFFGVNGGDKSGLGDTDCRDRLRKGAPQLQLIDPP